MKLINHKHNKQFKETITLDKILITQFKGITNKFIDYNKLESTKLGNVLTKTIYAPNGSGKSTFIDAFVYVVSGQDFRDSKGDLINTYLPDGTSTTDKDITIFITKSNEGDKFNKTKYEIRYTQKGIKFYGTVKINDLKVESYNSVKSFEREMSNIFGISGSILPYIKPQVLDMIDGKEGRQWLMNIDSIGNVWHDVVESFLAKYDGNEHIEEIGKNLTSPFALDSYVNEVAEQVKAEKSKLRDFQKVINSFKDIYWLIESSNIQNIETFNKVLPEVSKQLGNLKTKEELKKLQNDWNKIKEYVDDKININTIDENLKNLNIQLNEFKEKINTLKKTYILDKTSIVVLRNNIDKYNDYLKLNKEFENDINKIGYNKDDFLQEYNNLKSIKDKNEDIDYKLQSLKQLLKQYKYTFDQLDKFITFANSRNSKYLLDISKLNEEKDKLNKDLITLETFIKNNSVDTIDSKINKLKNDIINYEKSESKDLENMKISLDNSILTITGDVTVNNVKYPVKVNVKLESNININNIQVLSGKEVLSNKLDNINAEIISLEKDKKDIISKINNISTLKTNILKIESNITKLTNEIWDDKIWENSELYIKLDKFNTFENIYKIYTKLEPLHNIWNDNKPKYTIEELDQISKTPILIESYELKIKDIQNNIDKLSKIDLNTPDISLDEIDSQIKMWHNIELMYEKLNESDLAKLQRSDTVYKMNILKDLLNMRLDAINKVINMENPNIKFILNKENSSNDGFKEIFDTLVKTNGHEVLYSLCSEGEKIKNGIDYNLLMQTLSKVNLPIFIDEAETLDEDISWLNNIDREIIIIKHSPKNNNVNSIENVKHNIWSK